MAEKTTNELIGEFTAAVESEVSFAIERVPKKDQEKALLAVMEKLGEIRRLVNSAVLGAQLEHSNGLEVFLTKTSDLPWVCKGVSRTRAVAALENAGIMFAFEAIRKGRIELRDNTKGISFKGIQHLQEALKVLGLSLEMQIAPKDQILIEQEISRRKINAQGRVDK
ncbi:hypothetical protein ACFL2V_19325 [Pseudomonadota bacterium]